MALGRAMWSGTLRFALLSVPVKMYTATRSAEPAFHQIERGTGARIRYRRVSEATGEEVLLDDIVKGFDVGARRYVALEPAEVQEITSRLGIDVPGDDDGVERAPDVADTYRAATYPNDREDTRDIEDAHDPDHVAEPPPSARTPEKRTIEVLQFVPAAEMDDIYFDKRYHLVADPGGARPLALLAETLAATERAALVRLVLRTKEHLAVIAAMPPRPDGSTLRLRLSTLRFADEVLEPPMAPMGAEARFTNAERESAKRLVEMLTGEFRPTEYTNARRQQVLAVVEQRARDSFPPASAPEPVPIADLLAALQESIAAAARTDHG